MPNTPGDDMESLSAAEQRLFHLQRQLDIEMKAECDTELKKNSALFSRHRPQNITEGIDQKALGQLIELYHSDFDIICFWGHFF